MANRVKLSPLGEKLRKSIREDYESWLRVELGIDPDKSSNINDPEYKLLNKIMAHIDGGPTFHGGDATSNIAMLLNIIAYHIQVTPTKKGE